MAAPSEMDPDRLEIEIESLRRAAFSLPPCRNRAEEASKAKALQRVATKVEQRELLLEWRRVEEVARREKELHPPQVEECPICMEPMPTAVSDGMARLLCCGQSTCVACFELDKMKKCPLCRNVFPESDRQLVDALKKHVDRGAAWAMDVLGEMYLEGKCGLKVDEQKAVQFYRRAAEKGCPWSMVRLGSYYMDTQSSFVTHSYPEGQQWFKKAADKGNAEAQSRLASMYLVGIGGMQDKAEAARLFTLARFQDPDLKGRAGNMCSFSLGKLFLTGDAGLEQSLERAKFYLTKVAENNEGEARNNLEGMAQLLLADVLSKLSQVNYFGRTTIPGHNVIPRMLYWLRKALSNGCSEAAITIDNIERQQRDYCSACQRGAEELLPVKLKKCTRCNAMWYCGRECQKKDWKDGHKVDCCKSS